MSALELLSTCEALLSQPTAPFCEEQVRAEILRRCAAFPHVATEQDAFGNVIARYQKGGAPSAFAFAAHMDHPGYVRGEFLGGVPERYRAKLPPTRDFGPFAMWDLPSFEVREERIYSRACDDLIGCAVILDVFAELERSGAPAHFLGLFTRAEEIGFVGAIQLAKSGALPEGLTVVSLETSSERGGQVTMGDGVIIRVGDRTSVFDSEATAQLESAARANGIPFQRALMQGGTCEATAYQLYGWKTTGLCVALGNYHNCGPDDTIASEFVSIADVTAMARLCTAVASGKTAVDPRLALREKLERQANEWIARIESPGRQPSV